MPLAYDRVMGSTLSTKGADEMPDDLPDEMPDQMPGEPAGHYRKPGWATRHLLNPVVAGLTGLGISVWGSRILEVPGRRTGTPHQVPVNLLRIGQEHFLVSPRGETQWVRNLRAAGGHLDLLVGRRRQHFCAEELPDAQKVRALRAYLRRWKAEVGVFFDKVSADSTDEQIAAIAPRHPVFRLVPAPDR